MDVVEVKFSEWLQDGFNLYKENFGTLVLASLVAVALSAVTVGILGGPMFAGLLFICLGLYDRRQPPPQVGDVFKGFNVFVQSFLFVLVWGLIILVISAVVNVIPVLGQLLSLVLVYGAQALLMFGLFFIVERGESFWAASMESINTVKTNFWPFLGLGVVASIIGSVGAIACGVGIIITWPIQACILTVAYRQVFGGGRRPAVVRAAETRPSTAPPPPPTSDNYRAMDDPGAGDAKDFTDINHGSSDD
jgi:uncharacterized membrane protein